MDYVQGHVLRQLPFYDTLSPYIAQIQSQFLSNANPSSSSIFGSPRSQASATPNSWVDSALNLFQDSNPLLAVGILVVSAFISLRVLGYVRSWISFFVSLVFQLLFWLAAVLVGLYVYNRGLERSATEVWAWGQDLVDFWWRSYEEHSAAATGAGAGRSGAGYRSR